MWEVLKAGEALSSLLRASLWALAFQVPLQLWSLAVEVGPVGECVEEGRGREEPSALPVDLVPIVSGSLVVWPRESPGFPKALACVGMHSEHWYF